MKKHYRRYCKQPIEKKQSQVSRLLIGAVILFVILFVLGTQSRLQRLEDRSYKSTR